jgi:hypothetical protein
MAITLDGTTGITSPDINVTAQTNGFTTTGNLTAADLTLSGGVYLGGTGSANYLDDYEEGTWTPVPADASSGGNTGTGTNRGLYTKIGDLVTVTFSVTNIDTTGLTAGAVFFLQGLPFAAPSYTSPNMFFLGSVMCDNVTFSGFVSARIDDNSSSIRFAETSSGGGVGSVIVSEISSGSSDIYGTVTYQASS